jgi:hypothetical protein
MMTQLKCSNDAGIGVVDGKCWCDVCVSKMCATVHMSYNAVPLRPKKINFEIRSYALLLLEELVGTAWEPSKPKILLSWTLPPNVVYLITNHQLSLFSLRQYSRWRGPETAENYRLDLSSERAVHMNKPVTV